MCLTVIYINRKEKLLLKLFTPSQINKINEVAEKSKASLAPTKSVNVKSINSDLNAMSEKVLSYFKDSKAILISTKDELHEYVSNCIKSGYAGIDTETTGLDRVHDYIVGASLYYPGGVECYIPIKHMVPIFDTYYKDQLTYQEVLDMDLKVMDKTAISLLLHSNVITKVFSMDDMNNFILAIEDKDIGTIIKEK